MAKKEDEKPEGAAPVAEVSDGPLLDLSDAAVKRMLKLAKKFIDVTLALSRMPGQPRQYVQDCIRERGHAVSELLRSDETYVFICGLKGMEAGVEAAFSDICRERGLDWSVLAQSMRQNGRYHVETY